MAAVSIIRGLTGSITLPGGIVQKIASVELSAGRELLDVSHYGGNGYRVRTTGLKDIAGSCVAFITKGTDSPFALSDGAAASMTILFDTGCQVVFTALIGGIQIRGEYQGLNIVTFNFSNASDTAPVVTWDVTG